jgi:hypothetical protein
MNTESDISKMLEGFTDYGLGFYHCHRCHGIVRIPDYQITLVLFHVLYAHIVKDNSKLGER